MHFYYFPETKTYFVENWTYLPVGSEGVTTTSTTGKFTPKMEKKVGDYSIQIWLESYREGDIFSVYSNRHFNIKCHNGGLIETDKPCNIAKGKDYASCLYSPLDKDEIRKAMELIGINSEKEYTACTAEINKQLNGKVKGFCDTGMFARLKMYELLKDNRTTEFCAYASRFEPLESLIMEKLHDFNNIMQKNPLYFSA
jgi:hypothetical protein